MKSGLPKAEQDELRTTNKCFECKEVGYLAMNYPTVQKATPSHFRNSAIGVSNVYILGKRYLETLRCFNVPPYQTLTS